MIFLWKRGPYSQVPAVNLPGVYRKELASSEVLPVTLKRTASKGWKIDFLLGGVLLFSGAFAVSF